MDRQYHRHYRDRKNRRGIHTHYQACHGGPKRWKLFDQRDECARHCCDCTIQPSIVRDRYHPYNRRWSFPRDMRIPIPLQSSCPGSVTGLPMMNFPGPIGASFIPIEFASHRCCTGDGRDVATMPGASVDLQIRKPMKVPGVPSSSAVLNRYAARQKQGFVRP